MKDTSIKPFAEIVSERRKILGMTHKDLSEESGIAIEKIIGIENGSITPTKEQVSLIRLALSL